MSPENIILYVGVILAAGIFGSLMTEWVDRKSDRIIAGTKSAKTKKHISKS